MMRKYVCLALLFIGVSVFCEAQTAQFKPFTSFRTIKTEHFDIIFPKESEPSARLLASYADTVYAQVSGLLGIQVRGRIPVCLTPHTELFNGYYNPVFHPHIMLFDTPMDLEWTNFANNLESLFLHELTHAVSLSSRKPFYRVLHAVFGNWVVPASINAYPFMIEGVTVSFESLSGMGRANDPLVKQNVRQAIYENKFHTPFQAAGVYDLPTQGSPFYEYGGLFSAYLQQTYGMEKYAKLWQEMGGDADFSFFVYRSGYFRMFRKVYGINFLDAWNDFRNDLALDGIEENTIGKNADVLRKNAIADIAANGNNVFVLDRANRKIHIYDTQSEQIRNINVDALSSAELDISPDGSRALVSGYRYAADRSFATVTEHRISNGWKTQLSIKGLYKARYFRDGVIGIGAELHNNCIVFVRPGDKQGEKEILFKGNESLIFSGPQVIDDERIVFIAARNGIRELWLYNYAAKELSRIESVSGDNDWQQYMRGLGVSGGKIFFSHNSDDRMYKLATIDIETMQACLSKRDFSGGVFSPVLAGNAIYYRGAFFAQDRLLRFPETPDSLSGDTIDLRLIPLDNQSYAQVTPEQPAAVPYNGPTKPYIGISYMNPFRFWLPLVLFRAYPNSAEDDIWIQLDGGGLLTLVNDPTEQNLFAILAYADVQYHMADIELFQWQNTTLGFPLTLSFSDTVIVETEDSLYRDTRGSLSLGFTWSMGQWDWGFTPGVMYARNAEPDAGRNIRAYDDYIYAYGWKETGSAFAVSTGIAFSNNHQLNHELFGTGLYFNFTGASVVSDFEPHAEGIFRANVETLFPLRLTLWGAYDELGINLHGVSRRYGNPTFAETALTEYPTVGMNLSWLSGAEASIGLFSLQIQKNLGHIYYNRFFGILSLRNVIYDSHGNPKAEGLPIHEDLRLAQSLALRLGMKISFFPIIKQPFSIEPSIWGAWKFSNVRMKAGKQLFFNFNLGLNLNL